MPRRVAATPHQSVHVLLVQPHADSREIYADFLRHNGVATIAVGNGTEALALTANADVIVTGIRVPGIDGIELTTRVRRDERTTRTPIIVLTACAFFPDRVRAEAAGCDVFLSMPCEPAELLRQIRRLMLQRVRGKVTNAPDSSKGHNRRHAGDQGVENADD